MDVSRLDTGDDGQAPVVMPWAQTASSPTACNEGACFNLDITLNQTHLGVIRYDAGKWKISEIKNQGLANAIGDQIQNWYAKEAA